MNDVTYGDLEEALVALGFTISTGVGEYGAHYVRYDNRPYGAWIMIPDTPRDEHVRPFHLKSAESTVVGRGVAEIETFRKLLHTHGTEANASVS
jgi:hypothetical protein